MTTIFVTGTLYYTNPRWEKAGFFMKGILSEGGWTNFAETLEVDLAELVKDQKGYLLPLLVAKKRKGGHWKEEDCRFNGLKISTMEALGTTK